jgi:hypothetical protein
MLRMGQKASGGMEILFKIPPTPPFSKGGNDTSPFFKGEVYYFLLAGISGQLSGYFRRTGFVNPSARFSEAMRPV